MTNVKVAGVFSSTNTVTDPYLARARGCERTSELLLCSVFLRHTVTARVPFEVHRSRPLADRPLEFIPSNP